MLDKWLMTLTTSYRDRTLAVTTEIAEEWGRLSASNPPPIIDGLMAATAKVHNLTFVTRNIADVERTGVSLLNPFRPGSTGKLVRPALRLERVLGEQVVSTYGTPSLLLRASTPTGRAGRWPVAVSSKAAGRGGPSASSY
jgi:hypothetical protein